MGDVLCELIVHSSGSCVDYHRTTSAWQYDAHCMPPSVGGGFHGFDDGNRFLSSAGTLFAR
jgi:hypothetical protein